MNHDEIAELLGAYALDAVDDAERAEIESHLSVCARCRAEVEEHREVATLLAFRGGPAPDGVWQRIAGALDEAPPKLRLATVDATPRARPSRRWLRSVATIAAAAAAAAIVVFLGVQARDGDQLAEIEEALRDPLAQAFEAALAAPDSQLFELRSADGQLAVPVAVTGDGTGYMRATGLPELDPGRTYQLWGAAGDELVSLGVLGARPDTVSFPAGPYAGFAITEEAAPGVVTSANSPVVAGGST